MTQPPTLHVDSLTVRYGAATAVRSASFAVTPGSAVALVGPNGAGKTTILRAISGLVRAAAGSRIDLAGKNIVTLPAFRRARLGIAHVPEGRGTIAPLTVLENLAMGARTVSTSVANERTGEMLDLFPALSRRARVPAGLLSGGEQQMLAIARGLMSQPKLLMVDEPSMGLAPVMVDAVMSGLRMARRGGMAMLLVEQNVQLASELADRIFVIVQGEIVAEGTTDELSLADLERLVA